MVAGTFGCAPVSGAGDFLALAIGPLTVLTYAFDKVSIGLKWLLGIQWQFSRPPVLTGFFLLMLVIPAFIDVYDVRIVPPAGGDQLSVASRATLDAAFQAWAKACAPDKDQPIHPIIVAVSGGATRAALWAARVIAEVDNDATAPNTAIFAVSSVSGGSLGAASYFSLRAGRSGCKPGPKPSAMTAVIAPLRADALAPTLAAALLNDIPRSFGIVTLFARDHRGGDRAAALERAFEHNWAQLDVDTLPKDEPRPAPFTAPFLSLFYLPTVDSQTGKAQWREGMPIWISNGTDTQNGNRVLTIPVAFGGECPFMAALDGLALLRADVRISTAITNSARFPFLSPTGKMQLFGDAPLPPRSDTGCPEVPAPTDVAAPPEGWPTQIADGGYFENLGLQTALELGDWLKQQRVDGQPVEPIIVQATAYAESLPDRRIVRCVGVSRAPTEFGDDPTQSTGGGAVIQALAPFAGLMSVRSAHSEALLRQAQMEYCVRRDHPTQAFFHFYLYPGAERIPLNWVLPEGVADYMWRDAIGAGGNAQELTKLRAVLGETEPRPAETQ